jgi:hypothetical protein
MAAIANSPSFAKKVGVPQSVGKDFNEADKGRKFSKGGDIMASKMNAGMMAMMAKKKDGMHKMPGGKMMKNSAMKMAGGGFVRAADGVASKGKTKAKQIKMKSGGMAC